MFLDSDDELPRHACKSLLTEIERTGADFVSGQISRLYESSGRLEPYYPTLFARRRVVAGIGEEPELFLDSFTTNKLYDVRFLQGRRAALPRGHPLRGPPLRRRAVRAWPAGSRSCPGSSTTGAAHPGGTSISLSIKEMDNVRHRVIAARLQRRHPARPRRRPTWCPRRQYRFLSQDLRVYLNPLPSGTGCG